MPAIEKASVYRSQVEQFLEKNEIFRRLAKQTTQATTLEGRKSWQFKFHDHPILESKTGSFDNRSFDLEKALADGWFREEMRWVGVELGARVAIFRPKETRFFCPLLNRHQTINWHSTARLQTAKPLFSFCSVSALKLARFIVSSALLTSSLYKAFWSF